MDNHKLLIRRVKEIIKEKGLIEVSTESIDDNASLETGDLALDSIQTLEVMIGLEEAFDFTFDDEDLNPSLFESIGSLVEYIEKKVPDVTDKLVSVTK